jgi:hypothetical protein
VLSGPDQLSDLHEETGLLSHLSGCRFRETLSHFDLAAWYRPETAARIIGPPHQEDAALIDHGHPHPH